ncbi:hypothetical protein C6990_07215 [Nitrosopumilus sp. b3]|uniref:hypothetical protein n=1 Tax=Nitrosopumilus sp. b3 TaxID=2109909 RepID=UPI0015F65F5D|nr:hypothetical protein [Nitrosopumilus sp. b3]KAF6246879.1 hypothetical protein C6990_07215 [Nitrosopumilus sp. b3]
MEIEDHTPIVVFDNQCYLCMKFVKIVKFFARGKITIIGHYSEFGKKIRDEILDESALDMFWFIDKKRAYGGRAALLPLLKSFFSKKTKKFTSIDIDDSCEQDCKTAKAVFVRSASLLTNSKKINF